MGHSYKSDGFKLAKHEAQKSRMEFISGRAQEIIQRENAELYKTTTYSPRRIWLS